MNTFLFVCGVIGGSILSPLLYFILFHLGGYPEDDTEDDRHFLYVLWTTVSGIVLFVSIIIIAATVEVNSYYVNGIIFTIITTICDWILYFFTTRGKIVIFNIRLKKIYRYIEIMCERKINIEMPQECEEIKQKYNALRHEVDCMYVNESQKKLNKLILDSGFSKKGSD